MIHLLTGLVEWEGDGRRLTIGGATALSIVSASVIGVATVSLMTTNIAITLGGNPATGGGAALDTYPNEPASFTTLSERPFSAFNEAGWAKTDRPTNGEYTIIQDLSAPISPDSVGEQLFYVGLDGGEPAAVEYSYPSGSSDSIYFAAWWKVSDNWNQHQVCSKVHYLKIAEGAGLVHRYFLCLFGSVTGPMIPGGQVSHGASPILWANVSPHGDGTQNGSDSLPRDTWIQMEVLAVADNPAGSDNGEFHMWIGLDGATPTKWFEHTGIDWRDGAETGWFGADWTPVWGGTGDSLEVQQYMYMDHAKVSKNYLPPGMEWVNMPSGAFDMGGLGFDETIHHVILTQEFWITKHEVTQRQYEWVMGINPSDSVGDNRPVTNVVWDSAVSYASQLSTLSGLTVDLPTEAEWEYAAREAGTNTGEYEHGAAASCLQANVDSGPNPYDNPCNGRVVDVGSYAPTSDSMFDVTGNAWEWTLDWFEVFGSDTVTDPTGPGTGSFKILKGCGWYHQNGVCRLPARFYIDPTTTNDAGGFRLVVRQAARPW